MATKDEAKRTETADEETKPLDETIPGGMYEVNGKLVNAEGEPITKTGKVKGE